MSTSLQTGKKRSFEFVVRQSFYNCSIHMNNLIPFITFHNIDLSQTSGSQMFRKSFTKEVVQNILINHIFNFY